MDEMLYLKNYCSNIRRQNKEYSNAIILDNVPYPSIHTVEYLQQLSWEDGKINSFVAKKGHKIVSSILLCRNEQNVYGQFAQFLNSTH